ncbi:alpha/beta hydrolase [Bacillus wiedmannii]|uniref:alpha/beta hydrolase n=1 Tax=Bacillus wiedmannii TaxID=1890302 RepID=UPI000BED426C|nr:alpha/beta hydrolase [Bacillus wiedmannii]PEF35459.1 lipase [Bacillus wiedmannii]
MKNRVHPELKEIFSVLPAIDNSPENFQQYRTWANETFAATDLTSNDKIMVSNRLIPGPEGAPEVRIRIYEPTKNTKDLPGVLWIHGGGYTVGLPEMDDRLCEKFVLEADCVVVSVDYRLAPENPFPAPLEDCYAALQWVSNNSEDLGIDSSRIAIAGMSAGGGLTAALALLARDRKGPSIIFQMPLCPMIDDRNITPSTFEITDQKVWNREANISGWKMYLGSAYGEEVSPYAASARASDLTGLPPTYTCVGELDPFRDETIEYANRLLQAGVPTEFHVYPGGYHGFELIVPNAEISQRAEKEYISALKRALQKTEV